MTVRVDSFAPVPAGASVVFTFGGKQADVIRASQAILARLPFRLANVETRQNERKSWADVTGTATSKITTEGVQAAAAGVATSSTVSVSARHDGRGTGILDTARDAAANVARGIGAAASRAGDAVEGVVDRATSAAKFGIAFYVLLVVAVVAIVGFVLVKVAPALAPALTAAAGARG